MPPPNLHFVLLVRLENEPVVLQDRLNDPALVGHVVEQVRGGGRGAHEGGAENDAEVGDAHPVVALVGLDGVEVAHEAAQGGVVGVGQSVDAVVHGHDPRGAVGDPRRVHEPRVRRRRQQRVRELAEVELQHPRDAVRVAQQAGTAGGAVDEIPGPGPGHGPGPGLRLRCRARRGAPAARRAGELHVVVIPVEQRAQGLHLGARARDAVQTLSADGVRLDRPGAFHQNWRPLPLVPLQLLGQIDPENWSRKRRRAAAAARRSAVLVRKDVRLPQHRTPPLGGGGGGGSRRRAGSEDVPLQVAGAVDLLYHRPESGHPRGGGGRALAPVLVFLLLAPGAVVQRAKRRG
ncbi:MAG: hypothetical protein BJ554DRAFT_117, partial [Olpidium bornovanus]